MYKGIVTFVVCMVIFGVFPSVAFGNELYSCDFSSDKSLEDWLPAWGEMSIEDGWFKMWTENDQYITYKERFTGSIAVDVDVKIEEINGALRPAFALMIHKRAPQHGFADSGYLVIFNTASPASAGNKWDLSVIKSDGAGGIKAVGHSVNTGIPYAAGGDVGPLHLRVEVCEKETAVVLKVFADDKMWLEVEDADTDVPVYTRGYLSVWKQTNTVVKWDNLIVASL